VHKPRHGVPGGSGPRQEATGLGHDYVGTEHLLPGLVREGEGVAAEVLVKLGADLPRVQQVIHLLHGRPGAPCPARVPPRQTGWPGS
jgi:ATP-dependent Clp protease ATP-binding subunit ClpC